MRLEKGEQKLNQNTTNSRIGQTVCHWMLICGDEEGSFPQETECEFRPMQVDDRMLFSTHSEIMAVAGAMTGQGEMVS